MAPMHVCRSLCNFTLSKGRRSSFPSFSFSLCFLSFCLHPCRRMLFSSLSHSASCSVSHACERIVMMLTLHGVTSAGILIDTILLLNFRFAPRDRSGEYPTRADGYELLEECGRGVSATVSVTEQALYTAP